LKEIFIERLIIETQRQPHNGFRDRMAGELGVFHGQGIKPGDDYANLDRTTNLLLCEQAIPGLGGDSDEPIRFYYFSSPLSPLDVWTKKIMIILLEYDKIKGKPVSELKVGLECWLYLFFNSAVMTKDDYRVLWHKGAEMEEAISAAIKYRNDPTSQEIEHAIWRQKYDMKWWIRDAQAEGKAEGKAEGRAIERREFIQNMLSLGAEIPFICQATGLTTNEVTKIIQEIKSSQGKQ